MQSRAIKWILYIVPLIFFVFLLNSGGWLKQPRGKSDDLEGNLHAVEQAVLRDDWSDAGSAWGRAHVAMQKVSRRIELATERDEIQDFYEHLARLRGSIQAKERSAALEHVSVLKALFDEFGH